MNSITKILCGLPRVGKTAVGKRLAEWLQLPFVDLDRKIEESKKMSCQELYRQHGAVQFRQFEQEALHAIPRDLPCVLALGGGTLESLQNRQLVKQIGQVIYLHASDTLVWQRLSCEPRPAFLEGQDPKAAFAELVKRREPHFLEVADRMIEIEGLEPERIVQVILRGEDGK